MMQAACPPASSIIRAKLSVVEFQRQLYVSWGLGACDLSHRGSQAHIWCIELDVVESVDEVGPELQTEPLIKLKILVQTHIHVCEMRRTQPTELRRAIAERAHCRLGKISIIRKP